MLPRRGASHRMGRPRSGHILSLRIEPEIKGKCLVAWYEQHGLACLHASLAYLGGLSGFLSTRRVALGFVFYSVLPSKRRDRSRLLDAMGVCDQDQLRYRPV
jgi:hypothetical protein